MPPPPCTPYPYLMRLFDSYAPSFDQHLVEALDYLVPEKLYQSVLAARPGATSLDIIDAGCGTGLVGQHFREIAGRLTGIDISARMIQWAQRRNVYDQLILDDYVRYLSARQEPCDLVLAADVFIYAGDLVAVFQAAAPIAAARRSVRLFPGSRLASRLRLAAKSALRPFSWVYPSTGARDRFPRTGGQSGQSPAPGGGPRNRLDHRTAEDGSCV